MCNRQAWKRMAAAAMALTMIVSTLTGCGTNSKDTTASTEASTEAATENAAAKTTEGTASAVTESGPVKTTGSEVTVDGLQPFVYVGNSEENRLLTKEAYNIAETDGTYEADGTMVMIPAFVIAEETEDGDDLQLLANVMVYVFELDGTTLVMKSGGSNPCRIHSTGGEITSVEIAYTDADTLDLCGGDEALVKAINDNDALTSSLNNNIGMYLNNYDYDIDSYTIDGGVTTVGINVD